MDNGCPAADGARGLELYQKMAKESQTLLPMKKGVYVYQGRIIIKK